MFNRFILILLSCFFLSCSIERAGEENVVRDLTEIRESGELVVLTAYGSTSYFDYRDELMGYEYELAKKLAADLGLTLQVVVGTDEDDLEQRLLRGEGDLIAYRLRVTGERRQDLLFTNRNLVTNQVLVQANSDSMLTDISELIGKEIVVKAGKYHERLNHYNAEIGGGIHIRVAPDSLSVEDLILMVSENKIAYTIADNDIALLNKTYYKNINISLPVSFPQRSAWATRRTSPELMQAVNQWFEKNAKTRFYTSLYRKYFYRNKYFDDTLQDNPPLLSGGMISVYDDLIRQNAAAVGWDWRLLAALIHKESKFNPEAESWAGAVGLMQLMPATAMKMGIEPADFFVPEQNIKAGIKYLKHLDRFFSAIEDRDERIKFMLAAYNSGEAHILDARALASKYGKDPDVWTDNVEIYIRLKNNPEYYNDEVCRYGYARGEETFQYVRQVLERFEYYRGRVN